MAAASYHQAEPDFCFRDSNLMLEKYKEQIETKFSASYYQMRNVIEYIAECLNEEFEKFAMSRLKWISKPQIESGCITSDFPFGAIFVYNKNNDNESRHCCQLCREFKILRQKSNLNIDYNLGKCLKHSFDLVKVCLNHESNVDIVMERIVFESLVFKDYKLQNYKWFLEPEYMPRKVTAGIKYIEHENVVEFQRDPLIRCESLGKLC